MIETARVFQKETGAVTGECFQYFLYINLNYSKDFDEKLVNSRVDILRIYQNGDISTVINTLESCYPDALSNCDELLYELRQEQLIDMIAGGDIAGSVSFARDHLSPLAQGNSSIRKKVEQVMSLLLFDNPNDSPLSDMLTGIQNRKRTARLLNDRILLIQQGSTNSKLITIFNQAEAYQDKVLLDHPLKSLKVLNFQN